MRYIIAILGFLLLSTVLWDAFEVIILTRRVIRRFRFARFFSRFSWWLRSAVAQRMHDYKRRETYLSILGPLSIILLMAVWATGLIFGFAMVHWGLKDQLSAAGKDAYFSTYLYLSGTTVFTLGLGDVTPLDPLGRTLVVIEAGIGFGFLAAAITYLPVIYQAFSRREVNILLLDARAGSPPSAGELLRQIGGDMAWLERFLYDSERWAAELVDSHLSYPFLVYFRSQRLEQSWLAALTVLLDACALIMAGINNGPTRQAQFTFTMARCAAVDLAQYFVSSQQVQASDRLPPSSLAVLRNMLAEAGVALQEGAATEQKLLELRRMYEPYVLDLSEYLLISLPPWFQVNVVPDSCLISTRDELIEVMATRMHHSAIRVSKQSNENSEPQHADHDTVIRSGDRTSRNI